MIAPWRETQGDSPGRPGGRSSVLGHSGRSPIGEQADGSCRPHGKRPERVSHRALDGAQTAPPTTLHRPLSLGRVRARSRASKMLSLTEGEPGMR